MDAREQGRKLGFSVNAACLSGFARPDRKTLVTSWTIKLTADPNDRQRRRQRRALLTHGLHVLRAPRLASLLVQLCSRQAVICTFSKPARWSCCRPSYACPLCRQRGGARQERSTMNYSEAASVVNARTPRFPFAGMTMGSRCRRRRRRHQHPPRLGRLPRDLEGTRSFRDGRPWRYSSVKRPIAQEHC